MDPSTQSGEAEVTDNQVAAEASNIRSAEALNTPVDPVTAPAEPQAAPAPEAKPEPPARVSLNDERRAIMNERARKHHADEMGESAATQKPAQLVEKPVSNDVESQPRPDVNLPSNLRRLDDGTFVVVQKVNGVEKEVPYDRAIQDAQKVSAGQEALRNQAAMRKQIEELQARLAQSATQPSSDAAGKAPSQDEQQVIDRNTLNKAFIEDDEQASQTIIDRLNRNPQNVDKEQWLNEAKQSTLFEIKQEAAFEAVSSDPQYGEINQRILNDPNYRAIAGKYSQQILDESPDLSFTKNITEAFRLAREELSGFAPPQMSHDALNARTAAKVAHTQANAPVGTTQRQPQATVAPATPQSTRDRMRANRIAGNG